MSLLLLNKGLYLPGTFKTGAMTSTSVPVCQLGWSRWVIRVKIDDLHSLPWLLQWHSNSFSFRNSKSSWLRWLPAVGHKVGESLWLLPAFTKELSGSLQVLAAGVDVECCRCVSLPPLLETTTA
jgi:hypothetical protein